MTNKGALTTYVNKHIRWHRRPVGIWAGFPDPVESYRWHEERPCYSDLGDAMLEDAEFRALQLGTWLNTPDGKLIAEAVEAVSPPFYADDEKLLVAALQYAAAHQREEGLPVAGRNALIACGSALGVAVLFALFTSQPGGR